MEKYNKLSFEISEKVTREYSTSFYTASKIFSRDIREGIFSIYGFVRLADEIVDSFHEYDKASLLDKFEKDFYDALINGVSMNPVLHSFQKTVKKYNIPEEHVEEFLSSMKKDLIKKEYVNKKDTEEYIYGSADVVGLMCLKVFCNGNDSLYRELVPPAMKLGSAFQKVNFLRDLKTDTEILGRHYFQYLNNDGFTESAKMQIIADIEDNFREALDGLKRLPANSRMAVYVAYSYYTALLRKIKNSPVEVIMKKRMRISDINKFYILLKSVILTRLNIIK
jgi:15-cis-phytoene synthase